LTGVVGSDDVSLVGGSASFATAAVGTAKSVSITGLSLSGSGASNYTVSATASATANITANTIVTLNRTITMNPGQTIQIGSGLLSATDGNSGSTMTYTKKRRCDHELYFDGSQRLELDQQRDPIHNDWRRRVDR
jgi:hypothetical protein